MAAPTVVVDTKKLKRAIKLIENDFGKRGRLKFYSRIARDLREATRRRITTQGDGSWKPLAPWTQARTGRRKALITLRKRVKARWNADKAEIYFDPVSPDWDLTDHHKGYVSRAVRNKTMTVPLKNSKKIGVSGNRISFRNRKASKTPARKVWLSPSRAKIHVNRNLERYADEVEARINGLA